MLRAARAAHVASPRTRRFASRSLSMRAITAAEQKLVLAEHPTPVPGEGQLLVDIHATAVNRADILQRCGHYPPPKGATDILGLEMAGVVHGTDRRVMAILSGGGYAEQVALEEELLMDIPSSLTTTQAAAVPETWLTAYQLLFLVGKATAGDSVLIHAGASGVGIAATQIAVRHGLRVFGTCSENKIKGCRGRGMLDAFDYRAEGGFAPSLLSATGGRGVDVILDCVGAAHAEQSGKVLAQDGRWVLYGLMGGAKLPAGSTLLASLLSKRASLLTSTLRSRDVAYKAELTRQFAQNELPHFASGEYKVVTDSTFPLEQAQEAHERVESNLTEGKVVIRVRS